MWTAEWRNNGASLCCAKNRSCDITLRESGFRNPAKFLPWNLESWSLESGILLKESWIPLTIGIRNPSGTVKESGIQYLDFEIQNSRLSWIPLKPGSHMPPMHLRHGRRYCLGYCSVMRIEVAGNIGHPSVYRTMFSFVREVARVVPAATSQIHRRHMRTRLYIGQKGGNLACF